MPDLAWRELLYDNEPPEEGVPPFPVRIHQVFFLPSSLPAQGKEQGNLINFQFVLLPFRLAVCRRSSCNQAVQRVEWLSDRFWVGIDNIAVKWCTLVVEAHHPYHGHGSLTTSLMCDMFKLHYNIGCALNMYPHQHGNGFINSIFSRQIIFINFTSRYYRYIAIKQSRYTTGCML